jgi:hypothetical protein
LLLNILSVFLTQTCIKEMLESAIYINVHTSLNSDGEVCGRINRLVREGYTVSANGAQEAPVLLTNANGGAVFGMSR